MALFELDQEIADTEWEAPTFKDCVEKDIDLAFFNLGEHADTHIIDGKSCPVILEENTIKRRSAHWEAGAKQNFDTGLYTSHVILYIKVSDYGAKPKSGKQLVMDEGTTVKRTFTILTCEEYAGVYRMTMERTRQ